MKLRIALIIIFLGILKCSNSQWDKVPTKTKLVYSLFRYKIDASTNDTTYRKKTQISISLDTVVCIDNRKMFVFSECFNSLLFNSTIRTVKGDMKDDETGIMFPLPLIDEQEDYSKDQFSIFYEVNNLVYILTLPKEIRKTFINDKAQIRKFDSVILNNLDTTDIENLSNNYINFSGYLLPLEPIMDLKINVNNNIDYDSEFPLYNFRKIIKENNNHRTDAVYLYERSSRSWIIGKLFFSASGIIASESLASTKKYTYYNILKLIKTEPPLK